MTPDRRLGVIFERISSTMTSQPMHGGLPHTSRDLKMRTMQSEVRVRSIYEQTPNGFLWGRITMSVHLPEKYQGYLPERVLKRRSSERLFVVHFALSLSVFASLYSSWHIQMPTTAVVVVAPEIGKRQFRVVLVQKFFHAPSCCRCFAVLLSFRSIYYNRRTVVGHEPNRK